MTAQKFTESINCGRPGTFASSVQAVAWLTGRPFRARSGGGLISSGRAKAAAKWLPVVHFSLGKAKAFCFVRSDRDEADRSAVHGLLCWWSDGIEELQYSRAAKSLLLPPPPRLLFFSGSVLRFSIVPLLLFLFSFY
ncbi:hypothetical protein CRG98_020813 [Punica granatum]|uniref:Uncharacterized protein n=1 Tax=Punica granatum TaxID=22663 RepID=A0A2I0JSH4_PUNGR|nr:hypothetical protein CRG98_020813 [Punica granatum]